MVAADSPAAWLSRQRSPHRVHLISFPAAPCSRSRRRSSRRACEPLSRPTLLHRSRCSSSWRASRTDHRYRALRRLEAENRGRSAWLEAWTTFTPARRSSTRSCPREGRPTSGRVCCARCSKARRKRLTAERLARSALAASNYRFESDGLDPTGLVRIALVPRRNEGVLVAGSMFLKPVDGELVRLEGRLARNPSFWVKQVDIVRSYARIAGAVLPVAARNPGAAS